MTETKIIRVRPARAWNGLDWREVWERRELVAALVRRDLRVRYRQTFAGVLWVLGQPLITTIVLSLLVTRLVGAGPGNIPYPLFVYLALATWAYQSHALTKAANCFIEHSQLVQRVYLPRVLIPLSVTLAALVDFAVALIFLPVLLLWYRVIPGWSILALPLVVILMMVTAFGIGLWLATLNAEYRDIAFALPFVLQLALFVSPMFYASEMIPAPWRWLYALNPMVAIVEGMRWTFLGTQYAPPPDLIFISTVSAFGILCSGFFFFQRREPNLADVI